MSIRSSRINTKKQKSEQIWKWSIINFGLVILFVDRALGRSETEKSNNIRRMAEQAETHDLNPSTASANNVNLDKNQHFVYVLLFSGNNPGSAHPRKITF